MEKQELIDRLQKLIDTTVPGSCYKKRAFEELEDAEKYPNVKFILEQYPDFDHIRISLSHEDDFIIDFRLNLEKLKESEDAVEQIANFLLPMLEEFNGKFID